VDPAQHVITERLRPAARRTRGTSPAHADRCQPPQPQRHHYTRGLLRATNKSKIYTLYQRFSTYVTLWTPQKLQAPVADPTAQGAPASTFCTPGWARTCLIKIVKFSILYVVACTYNIQTLIWPVFLFS